MDLALKKCFQDLICIFVIFINVFINFVKRFLVKKETKVEIRVLKKVGALLLLVLDFFTTFWLANLFCSLVKLGKKLL